MRSFSTHALFAATLISSTAFSSVFGADADPLALALVKQQFINAHIVPDVIPSFSPVGTLAVSYSSTGINDGDALSQDTVKTQPSINVAGVNNATSLYTLLMVDGNYVGSSNPQGLNLHWLQNNVAISSSGTASNTSAATIPYAGPGPAPGSGAHRYTILLFQQPTSFTAPSSPAPNSGVHMIDLATYLSAAGLTAPVAALYYTVEVGTATVSVESTTAVNTATLSLATSTTAAGTNSGSGTSTSTGKSGTSTGKSTSTGTSSAAPTQSSGAAVKVGPAAVGGSLMGLFGIAALLV